MKKTILAVTFAVAALPLMSFAQANPPAAAPAAQNTSMSAAKPASKAKKPAVKKPVKKNSGQTKAPSSAVGK